MSFVVKKMKTFWWPVKFMVPSDGGVYEEQVIDLQFNYFGTKKLEELSNNDQMEADHIFCKSVIIGWKNVQDESGNEIPFSSEALDSLLDNWGYTKVIAKHYYQALTGALQTKN